MSAPRPRRPTTNPQDHGNHSHFLETVVVALPPSATTTVITHSYNPPLTITPPMHAEMTNLQCNWLTKTVPKLAMMLIVRKYPKVPKVALEASFECGLREGLEEIPMEVDLWES